MHLESAPRLSTITMHTPPDKETGIPLTKERGVRNLFEPILEATWGHVQLQWDLNDFWTNGTFIESIEYKNAELLDLIYKTDPREYQVAINKVFNGALREDVAYAFEMTLKYVDIGPGGRQAPSLEKERYILHKVLDGWKLWNIPCSILRRRGLDALNLPDDVVEGLRAYKAKSGVSILEASQLQN